MPLDLKATIRSMAAQAGYLCCGFTSADPFPEYERSLRQLMEDHPELSRLYEPLLVRVDPRRDAPWARTIVVAIRAFGCYQLPDTILGHIGRTYLCDRRYRGHPDHPMPHRLTEALRALGLKVKRGSGTSDRWAAARAGIVRLARNTFAVHPIAGSWINIECWRIDAEVPPDLPTLQDPCPAGCRRCLDACRTRALYAPRRLRMDRCIAWLTYYAPWPIAPELWSRMGPWIYGCDDCQTCCPLNHGRWRSLRPASWLSPVADLLSPAALAQMTDDDYRRLHAFFWYIPPDQPERWRANARRAVEYMESERERRRGISDIKRGQGD